MIDAPGLIVAPGFIDPHTHLDPQLWWDPLGSPSVDHGVTTVMTGNCSVTLAPCRPEDSDALSRLFYLVEEVPLAAFEQGIEWRWESFGQFLDSFEGRLGINLAALVGDSALRYYVMGPASYDRAASDAEIAAMREVLRESIQGGAIGFSTSRSTTCRAAECASGATPVASTRSSSTGRWSWTTPGQPRPGGRAGSFGAPSSRSVSDPARTTGPGAGARPWTAPSDVATSRPGRPARPNTSLGPWPGRPDGRGRPHWPRRGRPGWTRSGPESPHRSVRRRPTVARERRRGRRRRDGRRGRAQPMDRRTATVRWPAPL